MGRHRLRSLPIIADVIPASSWHTRRSGTNDPYAGFEPRIVPENITLLPKTTAQMTGGNAWNERTIVLKKGDSVASRSASDPARPPTK